MSWNKQEPPSSTWNKAQAQSPAWPKDDPFASETFWDDGATIWDNPNNPTQWDYSPVYIDIWSRQ